MAFSDNTLEIHSSGQALEDSGNSPQKQHEKCFQGSICSSILLDARGVQSCMHFSDLALAWQDSSGRAGICSGCRCRRAFSSNNGSHRQLETSHADVSSRDITDLQREVADLRKVVAAQSKLVKDQVFLGRQ